MPRGSKPKKPGWYPHRYGNEGMQSYWNGSNWTGQSRPKPSLFRSRSPGRDHNEKGAFRWVLLALGLGLAGSLVVQAGRITALDWMFAAAGTAVWFLAAVNARSKLGKVVLWVIFVVQAVGWGLLLVAAGSGTTMSARPSPDAHPDLERLWSECADEDFESCDLLWLIGGSETGDRTTYEQFGGTCGDRAEYARAFCMDAFGTGPDTERWHRECAAGDYGSCDLLSAGLSTNTDPSLRSDEEYAYFEFGLTCGGRIDIEENARGCLLQLGTDLDSTSG